MMGIHRVPFTGASWLLPARDVRVWTPPSYYEQPERRFPVVYAHEYPAHWLGPEAGTLCCLARLGSSTHLPSTHASAHFTPLTRLRSPTPSDQPAVASGQWLMAPGYKSWSLQHTLTSLIAQGAIEEPIVVMIESVPSDQLGDVGPDFLPLFRRRWMEYNVDLPGPGQAYLSYMCDELKPSIDERFRTRPGPVDTHALGSSMGGLCAFLSLWRRPDVFGNAACLSPVLQPPLIADVVARAGERFGGGGEGGPACRLYIDNGGDTDEQRVNLLEGMNEGGYWWLDTSLQPGCACATAAGMPAPSFVSPLPHSYACDVCTCVCT